MADEQVQVNGMDKMNEMVGNVEDDGTTVLLGDNKPAEAATEQTEKATNEATQKPDPLNLNQADVVKEKEPAEKLDPSFLMPSKPAIGHEVKKMRNRAQVAEARVAELEAKGQQTEEIPDEDIDSVLGDPDELVDGRTVAKLVKKGIDDYKNSVDAHAASTQTATEQKAKLDKSFETTREKFADFDQITTDAAKQEIFTDGEKADILSAKNPYAMLYVKSKERLNILNQKPASGTKQTNVNEKLLDPDKQTVDEQQSDIGIYEALNG